MSYLNNCAAGFTVKTQAADEKTYTQKQQFCLILSSDELR